MTTEYRYGDGSANLYVVTPTTIEYDPMKPKYSSSGIYDGGEPVKKTITPEEFAEITIQIEKAFANKSEHIQNREKGTGSVSVFGATQNNGSFILARGSKAKRELEAALKKVVGND
ncbi:MAG: hypothetical protein GY810_01870 [Aureispira sp.]|nr:hypothetical protein [Aureispira sp.]